MIQLVTRSWTTFFGIVRTPQLQGFVFFLFSASFLFLFSWYNAGMHVLWLRVLYILASIYVRLDMQHWLPLLQERRRHRPGVGYERGQRPTRLSLGNMVDSGRSRSWCAFQTDHFVKVHIDRAHPAAYIAACWPSLP